MQNRWVLRIGKDLLSFRIGKQFTVDIIGLSIAARVGPLFYGEKPPACCEADVENYVWFWRCSQKFGNDVDDILVGDTNWLMVYVNVDWCWVARGSRYQGG